MLKFQKPPGRPHVEERPSRRGVADAGAVRMHVVRRGAELGMLGEQHVGHVDGRQRAHRQLEGTRRHAAPVIGIGEIGPSSRRARQGAGPGEPSLGLTTKPTWKGGRPAVASFTA